MGGSSGNSSQQVEMVPGKKDLDLEEGGTNADNNEEKDSLLSNGNTPKPEVMQTSKAEPDLIAKNKKKIAHFKRSGIFPLHWDNGRYEVSQAKLLIFYVLWYLGAIGIFGLAFGIKQYFKYLNPEDYEDRINDLTEAAFVTIFIGVLPGVGIYLLREYSTHLPQILSRAIKFENSEFYKEITKPQPERSGIYKECGNRRSLKIAELDFYEGFLEEDHNDEDDEQNQETEKNIKKQWWLVRQGPLIGIVLSFVTIVTLVLASFFTDIANTLNCNNCSIKQLKKDLPCFIMTVLYPLKACTSMWFCIFFLEWQRKVYEGIRHLLRDIKKAPGGTGAHKKELGEIVSALKDLQKAFILLNKKIFQKTIVIDFLLFIFLGVFLCCKVIQDTAHLVYIIPLAIIAVHVYLICKWSTDLMQEHTEVIEVLNEMPNDDVENLRKELEKYPPQVKAFGGFSVNYSMMTAVVAFVLSIVSISGMFWPDIQRELTDDLACYTYEHGSGNWNSTLCLKKYCYQYQIGGVGEWSKNKTMCIWDQISEELFSNGIVSLKSVA